MQLWKLSVGVLGLGLLVYLVGIVAALLHGSRFMPREEEDGAEVGQDDVG